MAPHKAKILLVDDDPNVAEAVVEALNADGYLVETASDAFKARGKLRKNSFDLAILDRVLPDADGVELCQEIRTQSGQKNMPILFLSSKKDVADRVAGLTVGADDYLSKPFSPVELVARVKALLRRNQPETETASQILSNGAWKLDCERRTVSVDDKNIQLNSKEFDLLETFMRSGGRVLSRAQLLEGIWGYDRAVKVSTRVVDVTVSNLRAKLGPSGQRIISVIGHGYRLE